MTWQHIRFAQCRRARTLAFAALLLPLPVALLSQDGDGKVEFDRPGYRFTSLGERKPVTARVVDAGRRPVPNRSIAYRTSDPTIAVVTPQGVVQSRRVGQTRVWAVSGTDSTSALIVVDQWAAKFAFSPSPLTFDAIGAELTLDVQLRDASGNVIPGAARRTTQCRPRDGDRVVRLATANKVLSRTNGVTWIKCSDRGISDSVRVEVRQRPARAIIIDKLAIGTKAIPDTFRLRMRALDSKGDSIPNARATWASLNANMVTINPVSGLAQAVGPGIARIVTQVADATDTLTVTITGTAIAGLAEAASGPIDLSQRLPTLTIEAISPIVGDTAKLTMRAADAAGTAIANPELYIAITSTDTSVVRYVGRQRVLAVASGAAHIIARFGYSGATVVESISVAPRARGSSTASVAAADAGAEREFKRPEHNVDSARIANAERIRTLMKAIVDSGIGKTTSGRTVSAEAIAALAQHATNPTPTVSEARSGILFGGMVSTNPFRFIALSGGYKTGTLAVTEGSGEDMSLTEVDGQLTLWPVHWFGLGGGFMLRGQSTEISVVRWQAANVTGQLRLPFVGDAVTTTVGVSMFPYAKFSGDSAKPQITSLAGEAGVDLRFAGFVAGIRYYIVNFVFPPDAGTTEQRKDQFSTLRLRIGFKLGR